MRYNIFYNNKFKVLNMRTINYIFLCGIFFLLFAIPVKSTIMDFSGSTVQQVNVDKSYNYWVHSTNAIWDNNYNAFYYYYSYTTDTNGLGITYSYICKFDNTFLTLLDGCDALGNSDITYPTKSITDYNSTHLLYIWKDASGSPSSLKKTYISKQDLSQSTSTLYNLATGSQNIPYDISIASDGTYVYTNVSTMYYGIYFSYSNGTKAPLFINGLHFNPTLKQYPRNFNWIYIPEIEEYYLFYSVSNYSDSNPRYDKAFLSIYDATHDDSIVGSQPKFLGWFQISTEDVITNNINSYYQSSSQYPLMDEGSLYAKYINGWIYWTYRSKQSNNNTLYFEVIDPMGTKNNNWLHLIKGGGQFINLTIYDNNLCENIGTGCNASAQSLAFEYVSSTNKWWLFYHEYDITKQVTSSSIPLAGYKLMALTSYASCLCSDWVNESSCGSYISGVQKQIRVCNPLNCNATEQYVDCTEEAPTVSYKHITPLCSVCSPKSQIQQASSQGYLIPSVDGSVSCSMSYNIPINATNITTKTILSLSVEKTLLGSVPDNNYTAIICNPLISGNCNNTAFSCRNDLNLSYSNIYNSYLAGQTATSSISVTDVGLCSGSWLNIGFGWTRYWVNGQLCIGYDQLCGGWKCTYVGNQPFEVMEKIDCNQNETTLKSCGSFGCDESSGRCKLSVIPGSNLQGNDMFTIFFSGVASTFSPIALTFLSILLTGVFAVVGTVETKRWEIGGIISMGILLFFSIIGWIPSFVVILWILSIGIIMMRTIFFKGG